MNMTRNKSTSLYDKSNNDLRKKIVGNTMLQSQIEVQRNLFPKKAQIDFTRQNRSEESREFTDRNMKFKIDQLDCKLQEFLNDLRTTRQENRELVQYTTLLKQNLIYQDLYSLKADCDKKITGFYNYFRSIKTTNQERYKEIYGDCSQLWAKTQQIRQNIFNIRMRVESLQQKMGFKENYRLQDM